MEALKDPCNDRQISSVPIPPAKPLSSEVMFKGNVPNLSVIRQHLLKEGSVGKQELMKLINLVVPILNKEPNIMQVQEPVIIIGDIHGQYFDMIHMFEKVVDSR